MLTRSSWKSVKIFINKNRKIFRIIEGIRKKSIRTIKIIIILITIKIDNIRRSIIRFEITFNRKKLSYFRIKRNCRNIAIKSKEIRIININKRQQNTRFN